MYIPTPDTVQFYVRNLLAEMKGNVWKPDTDLCFRHAVIRASSGASVDTRLTEFSTRCDDCEAEKDA